MKRRQFLKIAVSTVAAASLSGILTACGGSGSNGGAASSGSSSSSAETKPDSSSSSSSSSSSNSSDTGSSLLEIRKLNNAEAYVYACQKSASGTVTIPAQWNGLPVTSIHSHAFDNCSGVTKIILPDSIKTIESYAFFSCGMLEISIPASVSTIGASAFYGCKALKKLALPEGLKTISRQLFTYSGVQAVYIPASVTSIEAYASHDHSDAKTPLKAVFYGGTEAQWETLKKSIAADGNQGLLALTPKCSATAANLISYPV